MLADAKQVKNLPGRPKRDPADSRWLAACFERGAITSCFVATPEFRIIRLHTRYRRDLTEERTRAAGRGHGMGHLCVTCNSCHDLLQQTVFFEPPHDRGHQPLAGWVTGPEPQP